MSHEAQIEARMATGLFIEPFYGGSHRAFLDGLVAHSRHEWQLLTLPEGEWRRRMRRGAQELASAQPPGGSVPDVIVATDMLDLPTYLALTRRWSAGVPVLYYLHENQFTYPRIAGTKLNSWFGAMNYLSALAADAVAFNSNYHRDAFLGALDTLAAQPNNWLREEGVAAIRAKSQVLPVGVELAWLDGIARPERVAGRAPRILWNHRWEFDKAPDIFARTITRLAAEGIPFELILAGEPGPNPHPALGDLRAALAGRVVHFGFAPSREAYGELLWEADFAVSTTRHEFFGIGAVEAMYAGCFPVAPRQFNYPALVPPELHAAALYDDEAGLLALLRTLLSAGAPPNAPPLLRVSAERFAWDLVAPEWDAAIVALVANR